MNLLYFAPSALGPFGQGAGGATGNAVELATQRLPLLSRQRIGGWRSWLTILRRAGTGRMQSVNHLKVL